MNISNSFEEEGKLNPSSLTKVGKQYAMDGMIKQNGWKSQFGFSRQSQR